MTGQYDPPSLSDVLLGQSMSSCRRCGAGVVNEAIHDEWHLQLVSLERPARVGDGAVGPDGLPWGVQAIDGGLGRGYLVACPEKGCHATTGMWWEVEVRDALWVAAASAQAHRDERHTDPVLPWGVKLYDGGMSPVVKCPLCNYARHHPAWSGHLVSDGIEKAAAAAQRHRTHVHPDPLPVYDHRPVEHDEPSFDEDHTSVRGPGWGTRTCEVCDYETFGGYESVTKDAIREHIHNAIDAEAAARV